MLHKPLSMIALALATVGAHSQGSAPSTPSTAPAAQASPAKKELINRILKAQQTGIEAMARNLAEEPAAQLMERAGAALPARVAADKRDGVAKEIQADVQKYLDEAVPLVQGRAVKLAPTTIGPVLDEKFTEDELRQIAGIIESPVYNKFQQLGGDMQRALAEKLVTDTRGTIEPKVKSLEQTVGRRLGLTESGSASQAPANAARPPAKPTSR